MPSVSPSANPTMAPTSNPTVKCFGADDGDCANDDLADDDYECDHGILGKAVRAYVSQGCATDIECEIGQTYGWPMNSWCVGKVENMYSLFEDMETFNEDISDWDTLSVTTMRNMFRRAKAFNQDMSKWNTSSVTDMKSMFDQANAFDQDLSNFDTSQVTTMKAMFFDASLFNGDVSSFNTSKVTDMKNMFQQARSFNQDVSNFDTSSVIRMSFMFQDARSFNQDVSSFDTSSVVFLGAMFYNAKAFNQDLCGWQDTFPYNEAVDIFLGSGCTYQGSPQAAQKGPFCASTCPKPTQSPTVSLSPAFTCYWVDIVVVFDDYPEDTSWDLRAISDSGDYIQLNSGFGTANDANNLRSEFLCLEEGAYQFTIYDSFGDGILDPGYYTVVTRDGSRGGALIAPSEVGGDTFPYGETTSFFIPFVPGTAVSNMLLSDEDWL